MTQEYKRAMLIFNPIAGPNREPGADLLDIIHELQSLHMMPEVFLVEEEGDLPGAVERALAQGIDLFVTCGGDGTIATVARMLNGVDATLGIVPTGTRNNIALSLGIPAEIESAIAVLRAGRVAQVDMGWVTILYSGLGADEITLPFLEICAIGLGSALFPSVDEVQRGDLTKIGDFLSTLVTSPLAEVYLKIEDQPEIKSSGHMVLIANMPFTGNNHLIGEDVSFDDGLLDVLFFADLTKLDLLTYAIKGGDTGADADPRIQRFQARRVEIRTEPPMPIMVDGAVLGDGQVRIEVLRHALSVMVGTPTESKEPTSDQTTEV